MNHSIGSLGLGDILSLGIIVILAILVIAFTEDLPKFGLKIFGIVGVICFIIVIASLKELTNLEVFPFFAVVVLIVCIVGGLECYDKLRERREG